MGYVAVIKKRTRRVTALVIALLFIIPATAQEKGDYRFPIAGKVIDGTKKIVRNTSDFIKKTLDNQDSTFVSPNRYNLTIMPQFSHCYDYYRFSAHDSEQSITLAPD